MKYFLLAVVLCSNTYFLNAQVQKLDVHQIIASYLLDINKDTLILEQQQRHPKTNNKLLKLNCSFQNNELVLNYQLENPGRQGFYKLYLEARMDGQSISPSPGYLLGQTGSIPLYQEENRLIWTNFIADLPAAKGQLELTLKVEWWGLHFLAYDVNCEEYPQFGFREKIPFYAGLLAGAGSLASGFIIRENAQKNLEKHRIAVTLGERESEYNAYTQKLRRAEIVSYIGIGILALDVLYFALRQDRHKKRIQVFKEFCNKESLSLSPQASWPTTALPATAGFQVSYQF